MTNSRYRWVIVAAGGVLGCVAIGGMPQPALTSGMIEDKSMIYPVRINGAYT